MNSASLAAKASFLIFTDTPCGEALFDDINGKKKFVNLGTVKTITFSSAP
jgi:hypothetical protein